MNTAYYDGDFDKPQSTGTPRWSAPFADQGDIRAYIYEQEYVQKQEKFRPAFLSNPSPDQPGYFLVTETPGEPIGAGLIWGWVT